MATIGSEAPNLVVCEPEDKKKERKKERKKESMV